MRTLEVGVVGFFLVAGGFMAWSIGQTWQPAHTNMLLLVFGIAVTVMAVVFAAVFSFIVGWRITKGGRGSSGAQQPAQVIGGMGRPLPPPPTLLGGGNATNAGTYNSAGNYIMPAMSEPWGEVD
jgi:hypothetical protein